MTPRRLDVDVVRAKLDGMARTCEVLSSLEDVDGARLRAEPVTSAAVERLLSRLVDLAVDINSHVASARLGRAPGEYRESFDLAVEAGVLTGELATRLRASVGMRNVIVHEYTRLDLDRVASAVPLAVSSYRAYIQVVATAILED